MRGQRIVFDASDKDLRMLRGVRDAQHIIRRACAAAVVPNVLFYERVAQLPKRAKVIVVDLGTISPCDIRDISLRQAKSMTFVVSNDHPDVKT